MTLRQRFDQLLIHAVSGTQAKFALEFGEDVDRSGIGAGKLHRLGNNGREHGLKIERRVYGLGHFAEGAQFSDRAAKLVGALGVPMLKEDEFVGVITAKGRRPAENRRA